MVKNFVATKFPWLLTSDTEDGGGGGGGREGSQAEAQRKLFCRENPEICRQIEKMAAEGGGAERGGGDKGSSESFFNQPWGEWETFKVKWTR